jgi:hypothetical protein
VPFLTGLNSNREILALYGTGLVMGFEIDRDETKAVLAAHLGLCDETSQLIKNYETRWVPGPTAKRANNFLVAYRARFGFAGG